MGEKKQLIEKLRKWRLYYFRCVQCALADNAYELGLILNEAADYIEEVSNRSVGQGIYLSEKEYEELLEYKWKYEDLCK